MKQANKCEYNGLEELITMERAGNNYNKMLIDLCQPHLGKYILEIGSGIGTFTREWAKSAEKVTAFEIAENCFNVLNERFLKSSNVLIKGTSFLDYNFEIGEHYNTIIALNVFEHFEDDIKGFKLVKELLDINGKFLLFVPAFQHLYGAFDKRVDHYRRYNKLELKYKLESVGFVVESLFFVNLIGYFAWYLRSKNSYRATGNGAINCYDKLIIPWVRMIEKKIKPPFGLSLFAVCK